MVKNVLYQDSMSRCDFYSNPYQVNAQSHPALKKHRAERYAKNRDTLESKLENQYFLKFKNQVQLPNGPIKIAIQVGKYLFLAVIFPIYFTGYAIPKWLLLQAIPQLFNRIGKGFNHAKDQVAGVAHRFVATLKDFGKTVTSPILTFIQTQVEKGKNIFSMIKDGTTRAVHFLTAPMRFVQRAYGEIKDKLEEIGERWQTFKEKAKKTLVYLPNTLINTAAKRVAKLGDKLQNSLLTQWVKAAFSPVKESFARFYAENQQLAEKVFDYVVHRPIATIKKGMNHLGERIRPIQREILQRLDSALMQPLKTTMKSLEQVIEKVRETGKKWRRKVEKRVDRIEKAIEKAVASTGNAVVQFLPTPVISLFLPLVNVFSRNKEGKKEGKKVSFIKRWKERAQRIKKGMKDHYQQMRRWIKETLARCKRGCERILSYSAMRMKKLFSAIKRLVFFLISALTATYLLMRLMLAWLRALLRYGMFLVRELAAQLLASDV